ncbi:hypothetical protein [Citromicrobium bathyomarinum]|uniref:hypothetical protein n=1 Tax=Citromicrobium bathyomarinum TaxID=72174 RepID=UPI001E5E3D29|nr:hypothetical protein [Citromicrobium bathyomarinum]MCD1622454.1 hypothetical protein [Citromicrobium bathyomarinum]
MKRLLAPLLLLAIAPGLSGCVAAAAPIAAGLLLGKRMTDDKPSGYDRPGVQSASAKSEMEDENVAMAALPAPSSAARPGTGSPTEGAGPAQTETSSATLTNLTALPPPSGAPDESATGGFEGLFAAATAVAQRDPYATEPRLSALLAEPGQLKPERAPCAFAQTAVLVDLDPGDGEAPLTDDIAAPNGLVRVLAALRAQEVAVLWLSRHTADRAGAVRKALLRTGLDPRGEDELYLVRYENESKDSRRQDASGDYCIVAILGDQKRDFDSLFGYLKNPDDAFALDPLIGEAWFLGPAPITAAITAPITAQTPPSQG